MITDDVDKPDQKTDRIKNRQQRAFTVAFDFFFDGSEEERTSQQDHKKEQGAGQESGKKGGHPVLMFKTFEAREEGNGAFPCGGCHGGRPEQTGIVGKQFRIRGFHVPVGELCIHRLGEMAVIGGVFRGIDEACPDQMEHKKRPERGGKSAPECRLDLRAEPIRRESEEQHGQGGPDRLTPPERIDLIERHKCNIEEDPARDGTPGVEPGLCHASAQHKPEDLIHGECAEKHLAQVPRGEGERRDRKEKDIFPQARRLADGIKQHDRPDDQGDTELAAHNVLSRGACDGGGGNGMKQTAQHGEKFRTPHNDEPQEDQPGSQTCPEPQLPAHPLCHAGVILILQFFFCRFRIGGNGIFDLPSPAQEPFQRHIHLSVGRNMFDPVQQFVPFRNALAGGNVLRVCVHHAAFDGERGEVFVISGQKTGFRQFRFRHVTDHLSQLIDRLVIMPCPHEKCSQHANQKKRSDPEFLFHQRYTFLS